MNLYLNNDVSYRNFRELFNNRYFVDKTNLIDILNDRLGTNQKYICITRPRRFGKTSIINMLGAYYCKENNSRDIFDSLNISNTEKYKEHLNKHNVIKIDFSNFDTQKDSYNDYINNIKNGIENDLNATFKEIDINNYEELHEKLLATKENFIFILDEWDFIFNRNIFSKNHVHYLDFLRNLLKDKPYVSLCYMTGILPISKHSTGSSLNMFEEHTFLRDRIFDEYFGLTENEVYELVLKNNEISYEELESWYNGYTTARGIKVYNPRSVVLALMNNSCESYWTNTGAMDEVYEYLKYDILGVRDDVIKMLNGEEIDIDIEEEYRAGQEEIESVEEIYSAMIVLGFLSYFEGTIKIPNKELMKEFRKALSNKHFGEVSNIIKSSKKMLKATQNEDIETMIKIIHDIHNSEIPILKYNDENSLSCVVTLAYIYARDTYKIDREEKSGKGYVDFCFRPKRAKDLPIILELKKNESVDVAINQIKEKEYAIKFKKEFKNKDVLIVAICYNSNNKEHTCKIEKI